MANLTSNIEVSEHPPEHQGGLFSPDASMVLLTWITFFLLLGILNKFAFKPILEMLDVREKTIQKSIEDAGKIKQQMETIAETQQQMLEDAENKAKEIVKESRKAAAEASKHIQAHAKDEAQIVLENARREIKEDLEKAQAELRKESAEIAVELASKLIEEKFDDAKSQKIINRIIKEI